MNLPVISPKPFRQMLAWLAVTGSVLTLCLLASLTAQSKGSDPRAGAGGSPQSQHTCRMPRLVRSSKPSKSGFRPPRSGLNGLRRPIAATRARVAQGDETSIVNLLLFGTSFTRQPRITSRQLNGDEINRAVNARLGDFEQALAQPGANERLQYARQALQGGGTIRARLLSMIERATKETETYARLIEQAHALGDPAWSSPSDRACIASAGWRRTPPSGSILRSRTRFDASTRREGLDGACGAWRSWVPGSMSSTSRRDLISIRPRPYSRSP